MSTDQTNTETEFSSEPSPVPSIRQIVKCDIQAHELADLKQHWWGFLLLGVLLVICGMGATAYPFVSSVGVTVTLGVLLLIAGTTNVIASFWAGEWGAFFVQLLVGILYVVLGLAITETPLGSTASLTLFIASFMMVAGIFRTITALVVRFPQWGWALLNGIITTVLGVSVFRHFPEASLWLLGTLVGVDMLFSGFTWAMLAFEVRNLPDKTELTLEAF